MKDRLKVLLMVLTFPIIIISLPFIIPFYKQKDEKRV